MGEKFKRTHLHGHDHDARACDLRRAAKHAGLQLVSRGNNNDAFRRFDLKQNNGGVVGSVTVDINDASSIQTAIMRVKEAGDNVRGRARGYQQNRGLVTARR
jgi:hypothetical protein